MAPATRYKALSPGAREAVAATLHAMADPDVRLVVLRSLPGYPAHISDDLQVARLTPGDFEIDMSSWLDGVLVDCLFSRILSRQRHLKNSRKVAFLSTHFLQVMR